MTDNSTEETEAKQRSLANLKPFKPGQSGNPAGRPKGARSKLSESFLSDALDAWGRNGKVALEAMATDKPGDFAKMIAGIIPKEVDMEHSGSVSVNPVQALMEEIDGRTRSK